MQCIQIKTREMQPPKDNIFELMDRYLPHLQENDILLITSKIVSIHQGLCIKRENIRKETLVIQEADRFFQDTNKKERFITIKNNALVLNAGIDSFRGHYITQPKDPNIVAKEIHTYLKQKYHTKKLGIIITDSHSLPLRRGVMCYALGFFGISPLIELGKSSNYTTWATNGVDALAAIGGIYLGESAQNHQQTPIVIMREVDFITFSEKNFESHFFVEDAKDMYGDLYKNFKKGK